MPQARYAGCSTIICRVPSPYRRRFGWPVWGGRLWARLEAMQCLCCKASALRVVATLTGLGQLPVPGAVLASQPRGAAVRCAGQPKRIGQVRTEQVCAGASLHLAWALGACAGWRPSGAAPMQRPTAPSARLQTPTGCQYRRAVGHNLLTQAGGLVQIPFSQNNSHHRITGGSVQHGLSAAIDVLALGLRCCAADKR